MYRRLFSERGFPFAFSISLMFLAVGIAVNYYAGTYATERASNYVTDVILSNIPVFDVDTVFVYGTFAIATFILLIGILRPHKIPFIASSLAVFYLIRAVFISLTHLGPFPDHAILDFGEIVGKFIGGGDMFFSGHTGAPFLLALIFWREPVLRYIFLAWSVFFAITVLLGHLHYSIDVAAAFFITYTIFKISEHFFPTYLGFFQRDNKSV